MQFETLYQELARGAELIRQLVELRRARIERISQPYDIRYAGDW